MPAHDIIVVGGSAGAIEPLRLLASHLPAGFPAAVLVAFHLPARSRSFVPEILSEAGPLPASHPADGAAIEPGRIYVAAPDHHLVVERGHVHLSNGPKEQHHRPSINVTFRTAAVAYRERVVGVELSGELDDGAAGLWEIKRQGGVAVVQHPEEAAYSSMPLSALREVEVDFTVKASEMGALLTELATGRRGLAQTNASRGTDATMQRELTDLTCPECRRTIWEVRRGKFKDYQCRVGNTYSALTMLASHFTAQENVLYAALVALSEGALLAERLANEVEPEQAERLRREAQKRHDHAASIRRILEESPTFTLD